MAQTQPAPHTQAAPSGNHLPPEWRKAIQQELRQLLLSEPDLLSPALKRMESTSLETLRLARPPAPAAPSIYADEARADRDRLTRLAPRLFAPQQPGFGPADATLTIALFTKADCPDCARTMAALRKLTQSYPLRVTLFDMQKDHALAQTLGLPDAPLTVFPDMMLSGDMPAALLERYIRKALRP